MAGVAGGAPTSYGRAVAAPGGGRWLQYWRWHADNPQDRGILRTGRHQGDWELVQVRVGADEPLEAVYAQHSGAERCGWASVHTRGAPVAYLANGSHAAYFRPGVRDRTFPTPTTRRGEGGRPPARVGSDREPSWMRSPAAGARAGRAGRRSRRARAARRSRASGTTRPRSPRARALHGGPLRRGRRVRRARARRGRGGRARPACGVGRLVAPPPSVTGGDAPAAILAAGTHATCRLDLDTRATGRERIQRPRLDRLNAPRLKKMRLSG